MAAAPLTPQPANLDNLSKRRQKLEKLHRKTLAFSGNLPPSSIDNVSQTSNQKLTSKSKSPRRSSFASAVSYSPPPSSVSSSSSSNASSNSQESSTSSSKKNSHRSRLPKDFDKLQVRQSCTALLKHAHTQYLKHNKSHQYQMQTSIEDTIFDKDTKPSSGSFEPGEPIYLNIQTVEENKALRAIVPYLIPLPNRIRPKLSDLSICLITKGSRAPVVAILEDDVNAPTHGIFTDIVSINKLKAKLHSFDDAVNGKKRKRRFLDEDGPKEPPNKKGKGNHGGAHPHKIAPSYVKSFDIVVNDADINPETLTHALGPGVYLKPPGLKITVPVPISLQPPIPDNATPVEIQKIKNTIANPLIIKNQLKYIARSSAVIKAPGRNISILVGLSSFTPEQLMENVAATISHVFQKQSTLVPGSWNNVKSITIKTAKSASMPVYSNTKTTESLNGS